MQINQQAPAIARSQAEIDADVETVWNLITDVARWPEWNPDVSNVTLAGRLDVGMSFRWKAGPSTITSTIRALDPPRFIGWTGKTLGINAVHTWRLEARDGKTHVVTEESWEGLLVRVLRGRMQKMLQEAVDSGLEHLRIEAERRTITEASDTSDSAN